MAEILCPRCHAPNRDTARFCADCGGPLVLNLQSGSEPSGSEPSGSNPRSRPRVPPAASPTPNSILEGRYRIEDELGRGGFGAVFKAWDMRLSKPVAVKENLDASPEAQRQFAREATILANLSHPNLPRVIDHFAVTDLGQYLVMDFVEGEDLNTLIERDGQIPAAQAVTWIAQVADALDYLHTQPQPVFHRDVKPANIRLTPRGKAMLVDFGLVKASDPNIKTTMGARAITPGYAPPEQYGAGYTDARTDLYALGATLYRAITGEEPVESVQRMTGQVVLPARQLNPAIPESLSRLCEHAMELDPGRRFQSAADLRAALHACQIEIQARESGREPASFHPAPAGSLPARDSAPRQDPSEPRPDSRPPVIAPTMAASSAPYFAAPVQAHPSPRPTPSRPASKPVSGGRKMAVPAIAGVLVALCLLAALGGYGLYSSMGARSAAGSTATVRAQATAMMQLQGTSTAQAASIATQQAGQGSPNGQAVQRVNLNTAGEDELMTLPGISRGLAKRIIDYRETNGAFRQLDDLLNIPGVSQDMLPKLEPLVSY